MTRSSLPSHPTAKAFFAALDTANDDGTREGRRHSEFIRKKCQALGWRNRFSQDEFYPMTVGNFKFSVMQVQRGELENTYGTGATVWPASVVLVKYLEFLAAKGTNLVADKVVVDLGAGTGVTSIAAALLGARHVVCTDGCEKVVQLARDNAFRAANEVQQKQSDQNSGDGTNTADHNNSQSNSHGSAVMIGSSRLDVQELWWGRDKVQFSSNNITEETSADIVLVGDCVLPKLYPIAPLVQAVDELLLHPHAIALLSYEHRYYPDYDPRDKFRELAEARGLDVKVIPMNQQDPVYSVDDIEIWTVTRRRNAC